MSLISSKPKPCCGVDRSDDVPLAASRMKLVWRRPQRSQVVIFDRYATQGVIPILEVGTFSVFENRRSRLHVLAMLHMVARFRFSWRDYCISYLRLAGARVVVTGIDSNATFYSLKHALPDVRFVAVQNGIRGNGSPVKNGDLWTMLAESPHQPPTVDVVATFGQAHSRQYARHVRCRTVEVGSSRSNLIPVRTSRQQTTNKRVGFISNFSGQPHAGVFPDGTASPTAMYLGTREVSAQEYFAADARVASLVADVCGSHGWDLHILGRRTAEFRHEREFFANACGRLPHEFFPKTAEESSYQHLDTCDLVVAVDSTLGYEMIARGTRTVFVAARALLLGGEESRQFAFGFPGDFQPSGPFWTTSLDREPIAEMMRRVMALSDDEWRAASEFLREQLMTFEPGNHKLRAAIFGS